MLGGVERVVLHVDLDQFIVAVELLRRPELRGLPVLVGGSGDPTERGVVAGASYEAREHRVVSGTPLRTAAARCPEAVFLPADRETYLAASVEVMDALREFGAIVEEAGWDEAFLLADTDDAREFARAIQRRVLQRSGLNCSVGIGDNKLRAKLASGMAKPAGVFRLDVTDWVAVMAERPAEALLGVGPKTARKLSALGIDTVGGLAAADPGELAAAFGPATGPWLVALAHGFDSSPVSDEPRRPRSRGREVTFQQDVRDPDRVRAELAQVAGTVSDDLAAGGDVARRVVVKIRDSRFATHTHGVALPEPTRDAAEIERAALRALESFALQRPIRLVGVRAELG
ncbi:DNA polymerase IV [Saccharopolyspora sp. HNM0983]|uniref:DNA polymerase IV n=1 Tax=Saccharopolyspora montiporae TaxID=2781240 RepID=A0A929B9N2_9PSEU|nr:DNA polymerase IV [Saccharopolyspora sp. HNM0983]MBE9375854.1 DNA polymerase IV [Saccharopolyspora sp. HNM0983]